MNEKLWIEKIRKKYNSLAPDRFVPSKTYIPPSKKVIDGDDLASLLDAVFDVNFTEGRFAKQFERDLIFYYKNLIRGVSLCNSGSSANLLSVSAMTSKRFGERRAEPNDEIITVSAGFPTTVNPIFQNNLVPVFVDVDLNTFTPDPETIENAVVEGKTKGIMIAHPLGNPFDVEAIQDICKEYNLWFIEDTSDALGGKVHGRLVGSFGDMATLSFYPAHMITSGEGGAVMTQSPMVQKVLESFRDWGRDCYCLPGEFDTCGKRFKWKLGDLPEGYDHKYIYSEIGYNLKITDLQASLLVPQLKKLDGFVSKRKENWNRLREGLDDHKRYFTFMRPIDGAEPSWFGFSITVKETAPFSRNELVAYLEDRGIGTRLFFSGNIMRQPAYLDAKYKTFGENYNSDIIMRNSFWIGVHPAVTEEMVDYMVESIGEFVDRSA